MKEFTLVKNLTNVNTVESVSPKQEALRSTKEFTLVKSLLNVNIVAKVLSVQDT